MKRHIILVILFSLLAAMYICYCSFILVFIKNCKEEKREALTVNSREEYFIFIDVQKKDLFLFKGDEILKRYKVATGAKDTPTPIGIFNIVSKAKWTKGFGGYWMGLDVPWGKYGIHGTTKPWSIGTDASHGCIRMRSKDASELYGIIKNGTKVEIYGGPFGPFCDGFRVLVPGDRGSDVMEVQRALKEKGYFSGNIDGKYGNIMEKALYRFEQENGLTLTNRINKKLYEYMGIILME